MKNMNKKIFLVLIIILTSSFLISGCIEEKSIINNKPSVTITYPIDGMNIFNLINISGNAFDPDDNNSLVKVQVKIDESNWIRI